MNIRPNAFQKILLHFLVLKSVSAFLAQILHRVDLFFLRITRNRQSISEIVGLPIIQLISTGAKSGRLRTSPLVGFAEGEKIALVASSFGRAHNPGWYYNLKVHPACVVDFKGCSGDYIAREVEGHERQHYWQLAVSYYAGYEKYKTRAAPRQIPVMVLEPKK